MLTLMKRFAWLAVLCAACGGDDEQVPVDAPVGDGAVVVDAPAVDAATAGAAPSGLVCEMADQFCTIPSQICCVVEPGTDTCMPSGSAGCNGQPYECDGPEDCGPGTECCLFEGQGARCTQTGVCGTTGVISELMCHVPGDCPVGAPNCCGTAPGPLLDLYSVCRASGCPQ
jgi:hypothetical protein